jgi:LppX_LprAFG lipoprotein
MQVRYRWGGLLALGVMVLLLFSILSACGGSDTATPQAGNSTTGKTNSSVAGETPQQLLQSSNAAMRQLKTTHFEMTTTSQTSNASSRQSSGETLKDSGDQIFPDELSMQLTISSTGTSQPTRLAEVVTGQKVYIQNPKGKWYVLNDAAMNASENPLAAANVTNYNNLLNLAEKSRLTDHGSEAINGMPVRHISANFSNQTLRDLLSATGQLNNLSAQQRTQMEQTLKNARLENPTLHLWIDETTSYVRRMELKFVASVDSSTTTKTGKGTGSPTTSSVTSTSVDTIIDYSKFNVPVKVTAPTGATATTSVSQIFQ